MLKKVAIAGLMFFSALPFFVSAQTCPNLTRNLSFGSRGNDVKQLQQFLISQNLLAAGNNTGYFGKLTHSAVQKWQKKNNIVSSGTPATTGYGAVGPKTRAAIARACGMQPPPPPPPQSCTWNGQTIQSGTAITAYQSSSVQTSQSCVNEQRTCSNGVLSGSYAYVACGVQSAASCVWNGQTFSNGSSITAYQSSNVAYGSQCVSEQRTCSNGTLSGVYAYANCSVGAAASCTLSGVTRAHGQSAVFYSQSSVQYGASCSSIALTRTCSNGSFDGSASYLYASCAVNPPPVPSCTISATNAAPESGHTHTLEWSSANANTADLGNNFGYLSSVALSGSMNISSSNTTIWTLYVNGQNGQTSSCQVITQSAQGM